MYTVGLYTLGCKVSQYETEAIGEDFEALGFKVMPFAEKNDVYVINTCTVTAESDAKCRKYIRRAVKNNPKALVMVTGCYSQRSPDEVAKIEGVSVVIGTENKLSLAKTALDMLKRHEGAEKFEKLVSTTDVTKADFEKMSVKKAPRTRAYVKIEDGCESKCTYCAISAARGRARSKLPEDVIREVEALRDGGTREIVLTGIETGSYGKDFDFEYGLADLICELDRRGSAERIRLGSLAPELIDEGFILKVKNAKILAPQFHLSMQSASNSVLRAMKRRYNIEMAKERIDFIKKNINNATFTTDLMVGFPDESEADFKETLDFVGWAGLLDAHVFTYSKREGTPAALYDGQISEEIKRDRSERLIEEVKRVRDAVLSEIQREGRVLSVIFETKRGNEYIGHSSEYIEITVKCENDDISGKMINARPVSHKNGIMYCEII